MIYAKTNQVENAITYFQSSIFTNTFTVKRKADTYVKIGILYEEMKDFKQALTSYDSALGLDPINYKIYLHQSWVYYKLGDVVS